MGFCGRSEGLGGDWGGIFFFPFSPFLPLSSLPPAPGVHDFSSGSRQGRAPGIKGHHVPPSMPPQLPKPLSPAVGQGRNSAWPNAHTLPLFLGLWPPALAIAKNAELLMNPRLKYSRGSAAVIAFVNIFFFSCSASRTAPGACVRARLPLLTPW